METGTHSPWVSRLLTELGHEVLVAHAQKVELITKSNRRDDRHDARTLARLARIDPELLGPVRHRSAKAQIHLTAIRARAELVSARTALVNAAHGLAKSFGQRLPKCGTQQVSGKLAEGLSAELREVLEPLLREVESLNECIQEYDERMEKIAKEVSSSCSVWNYKIPTRATNFGDSPNACSRSVMFLITSPKNECTLASQLMVKELSTSAVRVSWAYVGAPRKTPTSLLWH
jgi:transposase